MLGRILLFLILLGAIAALGLVGYSYSGYLVPDQTRVTEPVTLDVE